MKTGERTKSELLAPAGSPEALDAAIAAGADAVYFGASKFNARINAENFDREKIERAIAKCRNFGVRSNIAFNTLVYGREISAALDEAEFLYKCGADALILADFGLASIIKEKFPDIELHGSTQMSVHSLEGAKFLASYGFDRVVIARELDRDSIAYICENSPIETEMFIHGALCVSHSGQCLFSSIVGGRSGNRGECAQPCRLPYSGAYPLSLKDNCLAGHFADVMGLGAASYKIEGRMKSPAYVYGTVSVYRRLIDENRSATESELRELADLFSRSGFTDGYYTSRLDKSMNGIRTDADKQKSVSDAEFDVKSRRREVTVEADVHEGVPAKVTVSINTGRGIISASAEGDIPERARTAPLDNESVKKNLVKFGSTDFNCDPEKVKIRLGEGLMLPVSKINALRREAIAALEEKLRPSRRVVEATPEPNTAPADFKPYKSARFENSAVITASAREYFDVIYLPLEKFDGCAANGVILPPVVLDKELDSVRKALSSAKENGAVHALVGNVGHIALARELGFVCHGDFRLNVSNEYSLSEALSWGLCDVIPSPELTLARLADIGLSASSNAVIYGRLPLMLLEKCAIKQVSGCDSCARGEAELVDRRGEHFPVFRHDGHRNTVYNSRVTYMADKKSDLDRANILGGHFIFTTESAAEVDKIIKAYKNSYKSDEPFRRI